MATEADSRTGQAPKAARSWVGQLLGYGIGAACLYWVFHDIRFSELMRSLATINWWWVPLAVVLVLLVYVCAAWEWQLLLRPAGHLSLGQSLQAVLAGRFANDMLPVHAGYIVRVYLASRWSGKSIAAVVPSLVIERLFDAFWLAVGFAVTSLFFPLPEGLARTGDVLGGIILLGIAVVTWTIVRKHRVSAEPEHGWLSHWKAFVRVRSFVQRLAQGVRGLGRSPLILAGLGLSIVKLLLQALTFFILLQAYGFAFTFWVKLAVFIIAFIGLSMPSTPAGLGVFQFLCAAGLKYFGVAKPAASGFALLAYVVLTAPLTLAGFIAVTRSGLSLHQIRHEIGQWKNMLPGRK
jgi:glycosyltransferase 2 family protein